MADAESAWAKAISLGTAPQWIPLVLRTSSATGAMGAGTIKDSVRRPTHSSSRRKDKPTDGERREMEKEKGAKDGVAKDTAEERAKDMGAKGEKAAKGPYIMSM